MSSMPAWGAAASATAAIFNARPDWLRSIKSNLLSRSWLLLIKISKEKHRSVLHLFFFQLGNAVQWYG